MPSRRVLRAFLMAILCAAAAATFPTGASGGVLVNGRFDVFGAFTNTCTGEAVWITEGTIHMVVVETTSGGVITVFNAFGNRGVTADGDEYTIVYAAISNFQIVIDDATGGYSYTANVSFRLIDRGSGVDYGSYETGVLKVTPDGRIVVEHIGEGSSRETCTGEG